MPTAEIKLVNGRGTAVIDAADLRLVDAHRWYLHSGGYACTAQGTILMHRLITSAPKGIPVDHRDGNRLNNTRSNLRLSTYSDNAFNRQEVDRRSTTGVRGVQRRTNGRFYAWIWKQNENIYLGSFGTLLDAARARIAAELKYHGEASPSTVAWLTQTEGSDSCV